MQHKVLYPRTVIYNGSAGRFSPGSPHSGTYIRGEATTLIIAEKKWIQWKL